MIFSDRVRRLTALLFEAIFLVFLFGVSLTDGGRVSRLGKTQNLLSSESGIVVYSLRGETRGEGNVPAFKTIIDFIERRTPGLYHATRILQDHFKFISGPSRFQCHVFYVFVSANAP